MSEENLKKILFVLEMAKNKLKDDMKFVEYNDEARQYIIDHLLKTNKEEE